VLLEAYSGCVLIVSHDKAFMENVVDSMLVLDGSGPVQSLLGRYSDYLQLIEGQLEEQAAAAEAAADEKRKAGAAAHAIRATESPTGIASAGSNGAEVRACCVY
jgi:ABC transport system ATP-binding/permease protein